MVQTLPHEIWIYIFSDCIKEDYHPYQSLHILESTCKHFQAMISSSPLWSTAYAYTFKSIVPNHEHSIGWKLKLKDDIHLLGSVGSILCATRLDSEDSLIQCIQVLNKLWKVIRSNSGRNSIEFHRFEIRNSVTQFIFRVGTNESNTICNRFPNLRKPIFLALCSSYKVLSMFLTMEGMKEWPYDNRVTNNLLSCLHLHFHYRDRFYIDSFAFACRIHVHVLLLGFSSEFANRKLSLPHPPTLPLTASAFVDQTSEVDRNEEDNQCMPYSEYSGDWFAFTTSKDPEEYETGGRYMKMTLQFQLAEGQEYRMKFGGYGSDGAGRFEILDGIWDIQGQFAFRQQYLSNELGMYIQYEGLMIPAGVCGNFFIFNQSLSGAFWLSKDNSDERELDI